MEPDRAVFLGSYSELDPNDHRRIEIKQDWNFFKKLFFSYLTKYNVNMKKWTKGTGGGGQVLMRIMQTGWTEMTKCL